MTPKGYTHHKQWRQAIHKGKSHIEEKISQKYQHDYNLCHGFADASAPIIFCVNCGRGFKAQIGLLIILVQTLKSQKNRP